MQILISVLGIILTILFVVGTHEAGHFVMARLMGVKVLTFSIGFGKKLFGWHDKKGTEYVVAMIPLGGYVRMVDERESKVDPNDYHAAYNRQPYIKKFLIVLAGPLTNLICAVVLYWIIYCMGFVTLKPVIGEVIPHSIAADAGLKPTQEIVMVGQRDVQSWTRVIFTLMENFGDPVQIPMTVKSTNNKEQTITLDLTNWKMDGLNPDPFKSLGFLPYEPPIKAEISTILPNSPAEAAQLKVGDKILEIDHKKMATWEEIAKTIKNNPGATLTFQIQRADKTLDVPVTIATNSNLFFHKYGTIGVYPVVDMNPDMMNHIKYPVPEAFLKACDETLDLAYFNLLLFGKMVTGKISLKSLGGPITIFDSAGNSLNFGLFPFLSFLAFLSVSIGIINVFPVPGLDGGHLFMQTIEAIIGRPIAEHTIVLLYKAGLILIFLVLAQALYNDILRMF